MIAEFNLIKTLIPNITLIIEDNERDRLEDKDYPVCFAIPTAYNIDENGTTLTTFNIVSLDRLKEDYSNALDVLETTGKVIYNLHKEIQCTPILDAQIDRLAGWEGSVTILTNSKGCVFY